MKNTGTIVKKLRKCYRKFNDSVELNRIIRKIRNNRCALIFGAPYHSNMGDQAQSYCTVEWIRSNYSDIVPILIETTFFLNNSNRFLELLKRNIKNDDMIFFHSGYHTTDLYMNEENMQRMVIKAFPNKQIIVLPQTIYYKSEREKEKSKKIYNEHGNIIMLCRDEISYQTAKEIFYNCKLLLFPDIVTSMIGTRHYNYERKGILLCMRNDKEALYSKDEIERLKESLLKIDLVDQTDTTISEKTKVIRLKRKEILEKMWDNYSKYKVIITDRYHGTIFSLISQTPVIVLSSTDHKLSSGVKWFPDEFSNYVKYIENIRDVPAAVESVYKSDYSYNLPAYFVENYYSKLKGYLEECSDENLR